MVKKSAFPRLTTGVRNLDELLGGGFPKGSVTVIGGSPGAGKTILAQQICFHLASRKQRVLWFGTLSEPTAKTVRYASQFGFFDRAKLDEGGLRFVDLGVIVRAEGVDEASKLIKNHIRQIKPAVVVIDSFKVFDDLALTRDVQRRFAYDLAIYLMAWETTAFLLGEYGQRDMASSPMFSVVDGLVLLTQRESAGEQQRLMQIVKMRGTNHSRDEHPFVVSSDGIEVFAPRVTIRRAPTSASEPTTRLRTNISRLDDLLGEGIPRGSSLLVSGAAGTGKSVLLLEFLYRGARAGEPGILFSFDESEARLCATARGFGWDLDAEVERGMVQIVSVAQPDILVDSDVLMIHHRIAALGAVRVAIDSISVLLAKISDPASVATKVFQLATIIQNADAVGLFATDIPYGTDRLSRTGVEETIVDGAILLTAPAEGLERRRYLEIYKLRNTAHRTGRHEMVIGRGGIEISPRDRPADGARPKARTAKDRAARPNKKPRRS